MRIAAVEYLNTLPFVYGLGRGGEDLHLDLRLATPADCARMLRAGEVDVALIPVAVLPELPAYHLYTDYCIGAVGPVYSVALLSTLPVHQVRCIYLDPDSRTSVALLRILAREHWGIRPRFIQLDPARLDMPHQPTDAFLLIGDKVFEYQNRFQYHYDLAESWGAFTGGLPFIFAVWASIHPLSPFEAEALNRALALGLDSIREAVDQAAARGQLPPHLRPDRAYNYLTTNIHYARDRRKEQALDLFLRLVRGQGDPMPTAGPHQ